LQAQSSDTIKLSKSTAQQLFIDAQQKPLLEARIVKLNEDIYNLNSAVGNLQLVIKACDTKDSANNLLIESYKKELAILYNEKSDYEKRVSVLEKQLRKAARGKKWVALGGILTTLGMTYLFVTK
jgi:chromosome segregation ATPase